MMQTTSFAVTLSDSTRDLITLGSSALDAALTKLPEIAGALHDDGVRYDMLKGDKPSDAIKQLRDMIKADIALGIKEDNRRALYFADKKVAKDFSEFQKAERKAAQDHVSKYYGRLCAAMPDAPAEEKEEKLEKSQADKLRAQLETALKIVQGDPDDSLADLLSLSKGLQDLIAATYLKQGKHL